VFDNPLPADTITGALNSDAILFGAIGGPQYDKLPKEKKPETGLLKMRKALNVFANIRPAVIFDELTSASTLKEEVIKGVD
jgi:3-isopropylmalate dehydrogenase